MIATEVVLRYERTLVLGTLGSLALLCWAYLLLGVGIDPDLNPGMPLAEAAVLDDSVLDPEFPVAPIRPVAWSVGQAMLVFAMWVAMMIAMMLPAAVPSVLLFARLSQTLRVDTRPWVGPMLFALGYVAAWAGFCVVATGVQWRLEQAGLLSEGLKLTSRPLVVLLLVLAGAWQLTPIKRACLRLCRSPRPFFERGLRRGSAGALRIGAEHGLYCIGSFAVLMMLLLVGGITNPLWIVAIALYVLAEKLLPAGPLLMPMAGVVLLGSGALVLVEGL